MPTQPSRNKRRNIYFLVFALGFLILLGFYLYSAGNRKEYLASSDQWRSDYMQAGSWQVSSLAVEDDPVTVLEIPVNALPMGTYVVTVQYVTDTQQMCELSSTNHSVFLKANPFQLSTGRRSVSYHFSVTSACDDISLRLQYYGGNFQLASVSLQNSPFGIRILMAVYVLVYILLGIFLFYRQALSKHRTVLASLLGIVLLASLPLFMPGNGYGDDYGFHLLRIEGIAQGLADGIFPLRMNPAFNDSYGYPVSLFYGDALLYIPAILRLIGFSVDFSYKAYIILVNALTAVSMYWVCRRILAKQTSALLAALLYTTASYRLVDIYARSAVGEYTSMIFLPFIGLAIHNIYTQDVENWKIYRKNAVILALGMSGLLLTHILSVEMATFSLIVIVLVAWRKTFRKRTLIVYFSAIAITVCVCAGFWIPFLDYYFKTDTIIKSFTGGKFLIQNQGTYLSDYFAFFRDYFGGAAVQSSQRMQFTPGLILMAALVSGIWLWISGKSNSYIRRLVCLASSFLLVASNLFPWNHFAALCPLGNILAQVQFPWRYIGFSLFPLALLAGYLAEHADLFGITPKSLQTAAFMASVLMSFHFLSNYADVKYTTQFLDFPELPVYTYAVNGENISAVAAHEYMLTNTTVDHLSGEVTVTNATLSSFSSDGISMSAEVSDCESDAFIEFPRFHYPYYQVQDARGQSFPLQDGENRLIRVNLPEGFSGTLTLTFVEPLLWRVSECISLVSILAGCLYCIMKRKNRISICICQK